MKWLNKFWKRLATALPRATVASNFTPRGKKALELARKEAEQFEHNFVGTEHLLLALIALGEGTAVAVLGKMGINPETVRTEVEEQLGTGSGQKMIGNPPYTPRVKKALALAKEEAKSLNHPCIGTGHILLGLLREGDGVAARVLKNLGANVEKTRFEVLKENDPGSKLLAADTGTSLSQPSNPNGPAASDKQLESASGQMSPIARRALRRSESDPIAHQLTPRAQQVLALAHKEADYFHHKFVGTEHVLLGLLALGGNGVAANILKNLGVSLETVRQEIEKQVGIRPDQPCPTGIPYTTRVKKVLALASREATSLNHTYIGTEHILLGLLQEDDGLAARILKGLNVDREKTREEILRELTPVYTTTPERASAQPEIRSQEQISNFTPRAQQALALARKEADRFNHNFVGTEHLLLGIVALGQGTAVAGLGKMGINLQSVRAEIEKQVGTGPEQKIGNIPYTPRVKKVLALAVKEAKALHHTYVGTEHILLGLLREGGGVAARVLKKLDVDIEAARAAILKELDPNYQTPADEFGAASTQKTMTKSPYEPIDTTARYDVYCWEQGTVVVYRNALFKRARTLFPRNEFASTLDFIELEQGNGQTIFISRHSLVRFCPHGVKVEGEELPGDRDKPV